jgi:hypothetical protein
MKKYLFVIRAYNDIDHFTPVLDSIMKNSIAEVFLYSSVPIPLILPNDNLQYLENKYGLEPKYLMDNKKMFILKLPEYIYESILKFSLTTLLPNYISKPVEFTIKYLRLLLRKCHEILNTNYVKNLYLGIDPDLIIFDEISTDLFPYNILTKLAKENKAPLVAIPHGLYVFMSTNSTNVITIQRSRNKEIKRINNNLNFDWYVVQNDVKEKQIIEAGVKKDTIVKIGSLRYEYDWIEKLNDLYSSKKFRLDSEDTKILILPNKLQYGGVLEAFIAIIEAMGKLSKSVVLKPHTRDMRMHSFKSTIADWGVTVVHNDVPSSVLINWCDVGIVWGGSIGIELIMRDKPLIYAKYAHTNETIYDKYFPEIVVKDSIELVDKINNIEVNKGPNYLKKNKEEFVKDIIYGGKRGQSVSKRYIDFFRTISK